MSRYPRCSQNIYNVTNTHGYNTQSTSTTELLETIEYKSGYFYVEGTPSEPYSTSTSTTMPAGVLPGTRRGSPVPGGVPSSGGSSGGSSSGSHSTNESAHSDSSNSSNWYCDPPEVVETIVGVELAANLPSLPPNPVIGYFPYSAVVEMTCVYGTCWPSGRYFAVGVYGPGLDTGGAGSQKEPFKRILQPPLDTAQHFTFPDGGNTYNPDMKCCGFNKVTVLSSVTIVIGGLGGIVSAIIGIFALIPMVPGCTIVNSEEEEQALMKEDPDAGAASIGVPTMQDGTELQVVDVETKA